MKKLFLSLVLATVALTSHAQNQAEPLSLDIKANSETAHFVEYRYNCLQLLGRGDRDDTVPTSYVMALEASVKEIDAPSFRQAVLQLELSCLKHMEDPTLISMQ